MSRMVLHTLYGVFIASILLPLLSPTKRNDIIGGWSKSLLQVLNIQVIVRGTPPTSRLKNTMFVANHVSWIDIHALNSVHTTRFVAKSEIRQWPVFGWFAYKSNTLFIEREKRHEAGKVVAQVKTALRHGDCICFFPEGTTTDGTQLMPFKGSLLQAAIDANGTVWPFAISYPDASEKHANLANTEMAYWGDMSLIDSIKLVIKQRHPIVLLDFGEPISAAAYDRRALSTLIRNIISTRLNFAR